MRRSKHQDPKTRETPRLKIQKAAAVYDLVERDSRLECSAGWALNEQGRTGNQELHPFDLEERTAKFGERIIKLVKLIPRGVQVPENNRLVDQIVGAGTSVGANYCEANDCVSRKDFKFTIKRCIKEAKEARFFLRMLVASEPS